MHGKSAKLSTIGKVSDIYIEFVVTNCRQTLDSNFNALGWERDKSVFRFWRMVVTSGDFNLNEKLVWLLTDC